jgi:ATP-dependent Clp endopeptidase proteolytic subunit ClpP
MLEGKKIFEELIQMENPQLIIEGEITRETHNRIARALAFLQTKKSPPLRILIDSGGGSVNAGLDIYDLIRLYEGKTTGTVVCQAASMAAVILQACDHRICALHASILIHHVATKNVNLDTLKDQKKLTLLISDMEEDQRRLYHILCLRTGKKQALIARECKKDNYMSSERALELGLIDEII